MDRLTDSVKFPLTTFKRCQLCGYVKDDICEFRMWMECDENDKPEKDKVIVVCRKECRQVIDKHPRLYIEVPWGQGHPGIFMLLCGECKYRDGTKCTNPNLKDNGGQGLEVKVYRPAVYVHVCYADGTGGPLYSSPTPATECAGFKKDE